MKRFFLTFTMAMLAILSFAQIPQAFSYQAVIRDAENNLVVSQPIFLELSVLQGSDDGEVVYSEKHVVSTNSNGLISLEMGAGVSRDDFSAIDWSNAPYFVKTVAEFDGKQISGVTPLLAVPYALYAAKAGNADVDLSAYATKEEIPNVEGLASESYVNEKVAEIDLSKYYLKSDVDALLAELNAKVKKLDKQLNPPIPGTIEFAFSVSADKKVYFSQGNLQYQASTSTWRFAEHQFDMIGDDNAKISESYEGWIDLFGWGTSGYNSKNPYMTSASYGDYGDGSNDIAGTNYDWGVYNKISNGGNAAGMWRTLTNSEWNYVISNRTDARYLRGTAIVNGVNGLILLPDNWTLPTGVTFTYGEDGWSQNTYSASDWSKMEANGAVFLPAAGYRDGTDVNSVGSNGDYWSSSASDSFYANSLSFYRYDVYTGNYGRYGGLSVRLVQDVK